MTIRSTINRMFGIAPEVPAAPAPIITSAPAPRVHHEIMLGEQRADGWPWLCRVYAQNGAATEKAGIADTEQAARSAALSWAATTKAGLRGDV